MNKGNQRKTLEKYTDYLWELISTHKLKRFDNVNIKDNKLLKKYFPNAKDQQSLNSNFKYMKNKLLDLQIITVTSMSYGKNQRCRRYAISLEKLYFYSNKEKKVDSDIDEYLRQIFELYPETDYILEENDDGKYVKTDSPFKEKDSISEEISEEESTVSDPDIRPRHYNVVKVENIVSRLDPSSMNKVRFKHEGFSEDELNNIAILIGEYAKNYNEVYQECTELCEYINKRTHQSIRIKMNVKVSRSNTFTTI